VPYEDSDNEVEAETRCARDVGGGAAQHTATGNGPSPARPRWADVLDSSDDEQDIAWLAASSASFHRLESGAKISANEHGKRLSGTIDTPDADAALAGRSRKSRARRGQLQGKAPVTARSAANSTTQGADDQWGRTGRGNARRGVQPKDCDPDAADAWHADAWEADTWEANAWQAQGHGKNGDASWWEGRGSSWQRAAKDASWPEWRVGGRQSRARQQLYGGARGYLPQRQAFPVKQQCQFIIGIEEDTKFRVVRRLLGSHGAHVKAIAEKTGAKLRLRGRGSKFLEGYEQQESNDPLMLCVSVPDPAAYAETVGLIRAHLEAIYKDYSDYCAESGIAAETPRIKIHEGAREGSY